MEHKKINRGEFEEEAIKGFDYRTHVYDKKTKQIGAFQPYRVQFEKGGATKLERPIGSGKFYHEDNSPVLTENKHVLKSAKTDTSGETA